MGRVALGATDLSFEDSFYTSDWRGMQLSTASFGSTQSPTNLSLCGFLNYHITPHGIGTNYNSPPSTNYSVNTYCKSKGYSYYFKLINTTNQTIRVDNPAGSTTTTPTGGYPWSTSSSTGVINVTNFAISDTTEYVRIRATAGSGYSWSGWYTAAGPGGSVITTSADYNATYSFTTVINNMSWYARNVAAPTYWSTSVGNGATPTIACYSPGGGYTIYFSGTQGAKTFNTVAGPVYINTSPVQESPNQYYSQGAKVRFYNAATNNFGPQAFCPSV